MTVVEQPPPHPSVVSPVDTGYTLVAVEQQHVAGMVAAGMVVVVAHRLAAAGHSFVGHIQLVGLAVGIVVDIHLADCSLRAVGIHLVVDILPAVGVPAGVHSLRLQQLQTGSLHNIMR